VILDMATAVNGKPVALRPGGDGDQTKAALTEVDLTGPGPVLSVHEAVSRATGTRLTSASARDEVAAVCVRHGLRAAPDASPGQLVMELYAALVEKQTQTPTFYRDFPVEG